LFVPYALDNRDEYAATAKKPYEKWGFHFESIHQADDPVKAVLSAEAIFIGGGNTFRLLKGIDFSAEFKTLWSRWKSGILVEKATIVYP
jgi:dipeptidase E